MKHIAIIDFEASCLPEDAASFPIEVALAKVNGPTLTWLIKPAPQWRYWDWSEDAEELHGISQDMLAREGMTPWQVIEELAEAARGYAVYSDCDLDAYWLETLARVCGVPSPFPIRFLGEFLYAEGITSLEVELALDHAKREMPREHVARDDATRLALAMRMLAVSRDKVTEFV